MMKLDDSLFNVSVISELQVFIHMGFKTFTFSYILKRFVYKVNIDK